MHLFRASLLLGAALFPSPAPARRAPATSQARAATPAPAAALKPVAFTERTLANGLRVYAIRDTGTSNVAVQIWYDVGSKNDPAGRSGFAHMFEHLMFKATRNLVPEQMDRLTEDVGGYNNASTNDDYTNYVEVVPANHLQPLLFAEADRMASLVVDAKNFASERAVVEEELRQTTLAQPYGKLFSVYVPAISYTRHPYARATIGSIDNLESASLDDIRAFHATYYRPDNAILLVSGNFDPAQLDAWVDRYFAGIRKPDHPIPRVTVAEPERTVATRYKVYEPNTPTPAVLISYPLPPDKDPDTPAISVLNALLSQGDSARLHQDLIYRDELAQSADTLLDTRQGPGSLSVFAVMAGGKSVDDGEAALRGEVARLRDAPVGAAELRKARSQILTAALKGRETAEGKASALAASVIIDGDPRVSDRQLGQIARVTAADVQRVARKYLREERSATIQYLPIETAPADAKGDAIAVAPTVLVSPLAPPPDVEVVTQAPEAERLKPPAAGPALAATLPSPHMFRLANGLRVITVERHNLPLFTATLVAPGGGAADPANRAGLATLTADLLTKGTRTRSATQIASSIEALGGSIDSGADWDSMSISLTVKSDQATPALAVLADVARHPAFSPEEVERARTQAIDDITVTLKDPAQLAGLVASRAVFGNGAYGHALSGTPETLRAITRPDIGAAYQATWRPGQTALILVGDIDPSAARALAERYFGDWNAGRVSPGSVTAPDPGAPPPPRIIVIDMPDAGQATVVVAEPGIARNDPDYYPASIANSVLGGGYSSRLNLEIRIRRGLAYGADSGLSARRESGMIWSQTQTKNPSAAEVVAITLAEMKRLGIEPVGSTELETRKTALIGDFGRNIETTAGIAEVLAGYAARQVPLDQLGQFTPSVAAIGASAVRAAAAKLFDPSRASIIVVGDSKQFIAALRKDHPDLELIPASALNLDRAALK